MAKQYSAEFFSSLLEAIQKLCREHLDFDHCVDISGYLALEIDNYKKERFVVSELLQRAGDFISESYCTKAFKTSKKTPCGKTRKDSFNMEVCLTPSQVSTDSCASQTDSEGNIFSAQTDSTATQTVSSSVTTATCSSQTVVSTVSSESQTQADATSSLTAPSASTTSSQTETSSTVCPVSTTSSASQTFPDTKFLVKSTSTASQTSCERNTFILSQTSINNDSSLNQATSPANITTQMSKNNDHSVKPATSQTPVSTSASSVTSPEGDILNKSSSPFPTVSTASAASQTNLSGEYSVCSGPYMISTRSTSKRVDVTASTSSDTSKTSQPRRVTVGLFKNRFENPFRAGSKRVSDTASDVTQQKVCKTSVKSAEVEQQNQYVTQTTGFSWDIDTSELDSSVGKDSENQKTQVYFTRGTEEFAEFSKVSLCARHRFPFSGLKEHPNFQKAVSAVLQQIPCLTASRNKVESLMLSADRESRKRHMTKKTGPGISRVRLFPSDIEKSKSDCIVLAQNDAPKCPVCKTIGTDRPVVVCSSCDGVYHENCLVHHVSGSKPWVCPLCSDIGEDYIKTEPLDESELTEDTATTVSAEAAKMSEDDEDDDDSVEEEQPIGTQKQLEKLLKIFDCKSKAELVKLAQKGIPRHKLSESQKSLLDSLFYTAFKSDRKVAGEVQEEVGCSKIAAKKIMSAKKISQQTKQ